MRDYFDPRIDGLYSLLLQDPYSPPRGFEYYSEGGLTILLSGPPGVGKTVLSCQVAMAAAATKDKKTDVIYFTKDSPAEVLKTRISETFHFFDSELKQEDKPTLFCLNERSDVSVIDKAKPFVALVDFSETAVAAGWSDRYGPVDSMSRAISLLQPQMRKQFDNLLSQRKQLGDRKLLVVCDALRPDVLEEQLRYHPQRHGEVDSKYPYTTGILLLVMEGVDVPQSVQLAYPPDVHIALGQRSDSHGIETPTIQLKKTRYQKSLDEAVPFIVVGAGDAVGKAMNYAFHQKITIKPNSGKPNSGKPKVEINRVTENDPKGFRQRSPGITVIPPLAEEAGAPAAPSPPDDQKSDVVRFCIEGMDNCVGEGNLVGGGCTLLLAQSRSGSTALALHFALAQIADNMLHERIPNSVLYISLSGDIHDILHSIWRTFPLRDALASSFREIEWKTVAESPLTQGGRRGSQMGDALYELALRSHQGSSALGPNLYIYVPAFRWVTPEEALDSVARILRFHIPPVTIQDESEREKHRVLQIDRVVLDRVARMKSRWPLINEHEVFVSGLLAACRQYGAEILLIDDSAEAFQGAGESSSRWAGNAQNIIRLRRANFQGREVRTVELVRAAGRDIRALRPRELSFEEARISEKGNVKDADRNESQLLERATTIRVHDSFRGYTGLFGDNPRRSQVIVELSYDSTHTALWREVQSLKQGIEASTDGVRVDVLPPGTWGAASRAYQHLSNVARETCHIVAIDGIKLQDLLEASQTQPRVLHRFSDEDILTLFGCDAIEDIRARYVTRALTCALVCQRARKKLADPSDVGPISSSDVDLDLRFAVPMRHNWGILAVTQPAKQHLRYVFEKVALGHKRTPSNAEGTGSQPGQTELSNSTELVAALLTCRNATHRYQRFSRNISDDEWKICANAVLHILTGDTKFKITPGDAVFNKISSTIWKESSTTAPGFTWAELAEYRINYWHPFWEGGWFWAARSEIVAREHAVVDPWILLFPRIDIFSLAMSSKESLVSFYLELLLAEAEFTDVFENLPGVPIEKNKGLPAIYMLKESPEAKRAHVRALMLFFALLSKTHRRLIAGGQSDIDQEIGSVHPQFMAGTTKYIEAFKDWPTQFSVFSREWLTTVNELLPRYDIRESIRCTVLPKGSSTDSTSYWSKAGVPGNRAGGPCVAGTWYLGVLEGGNADLGADVIREVTSPEREKDRVMRKSSGPVTKESYAKHPSTDPLPYVQIIGNTVSVENEKMLEKAEATFPFERNQFWMYDAIAPYIVQMIEVAMRYELDDERYLLPPTPKSKELSSATASQDREERRSGRSAFLAHLSRTVDAAVRMINEEYRRPVVEPPSKKTPSNKAPAKKTAAKLGHEAK